MIGADTLQAIGLTGPLVFVPFILMCCLLNLALGSTSAQWAITAPIITPMMSSFGLILAFAPRYDTKLGIGALVAIMLPYTILFLTGWMLTFFIGVCRLVLPVGPAAPTYYGGG